MKITESQPRVHGENRSSNKRTTLILQKKPDSTVASCLWSKRREYVIWNKEIHKELDKSVRELVEKHSAVSRRLN